MQSEPMKRFLFFFVVCLFAATLVLAYRGAGTTLFAQETDGSKQEEGAMTEVMRRFLADQEPPLTGLVPTAAIPCVGGMADIYPCSNVDLLANIPLSTMSATAGNDSWGWTDSLDGKEYALMGLNNGTAFVDISDPENPIYLGKLPTHTSSSSWRDIKVYDNHAFVVSEASGHGMQVFDLTLLRNVVNPPVTFSNTAHYSQFGNAHNLVINEGSGYAYAVGTSTCSGGLHMVNIQNPTSPTNAGCFSADGYTHDAQCVNYIGPDPDHQGDEICFNYNEDTLTIVDVTNKAAPVQLSRTPYPGSSYTHQGWTTLDQQYILLDDELDEQNSGHNTRTYVWDISNLETPVLMGNYTAAVAAIDHNLYTKGSYAFEANYRSGLRILDTTDVSSATLSEVAYFDTYPTNNIASFNGAWSNYPYFASGVVVISDIERGLFLVRPNLATFALSVEPASLNICQGEDALYTVTVTENNSTAPVTLTAVNVPAGANSTFSVNPVTPTGTSVFSVTNTAVIPVGSYSMGIVGSNVTDTLTSTVDLVVSLGAPGTAVLTAPANGATGVSRTPTFTWNAVAGAISYYLEVAEDINFTNTIYTTVVGSASHTLPGSDTLDDGTTYYWRVTASNSCGAGTASTIFSFTTELLPGTCAPGDIPVILYETDLEDGAPGWTHSGTQDTWTLSGAQTTSGVNAWFAQDPTTLSDQRLVSPAIVLPDVSQSPITLRFENRQAFETPNADGTCWDAGILEVSTNGGSSWAQVPQSALLSDPYDNTIWNNTPGNNPITIDYGATLAWCDPGEPPIWVTSIVDVDAYAGSTVQFRWRLGSDSAAGNEGWYLDDIQVQSCAPSGYGVTLSPDMAASGAAGTSVTYQVVITNSGTMSDTFDLAVSGENWTTSLSTPSVMLEPGESSTFTATVEIPAAAMGNTSDMATITATSQGNGSMSDEVQLTTTATAVYGITTSADPTELSGEAGEVLTYTVHLTNTGNTTDTFSLSTLDDNGWMSHVEPVTVTLAAGEWGSVMVMVHVPMAAPDGEMNVTTVTAVSDSDPSATASVELTSTAGAPSYMLYLPIILKP